MPNSVIIIPLINCVIWYVDAIRSGSCRDQSCFFSPLNHSFYWCNISKVTILISNAKNPTWFCVNLVLWMNVDLAPVRNWPRWRQFLIFPPLRYVRGIVFEINQSYPIINAQRYIKKKCLMHTIRDVWYWKNRAHCGQSKPNRGIFFSFTRSVIIKAV